MYNNHSWICSNRNVNSPPITIEAVPEVMPNTNRRSAQESTSINIDFENDASIQQRYNSGGQFIRQQFMSFLNEGQLYEDTNNIDALLQAEQVQQQGEEEEEAPQQQQSQQAEPITNRAQRPVWQSNLNQAVNIIMPTSINFLPFLCIIFVKFIHDHFLDFLAIVITQFIVYLVNKSLCEQITKAQKSYYILMREFLFAAGVVMLRFQFSTGTLDPFGLLVAPPAQYTWRSIVPQTEQQPTQTNMQLTQTISLSLVLFYVIINDLMLKLFTIMSKILITMLPDKLLRPKPRARLFVFIEYISQCYRAFAPMREWVFYLRASYEGIKALFSFVFIFLYMTAKCFEFVQRLKLLIKSFMCLLHNWDSERQPTENELNRTDRICPICHDTFNSPVVIECGHIFCDECVSTWLKREQTCPMCRAKLRPDLAYQDGSTSYFYQVF